MTTISLKVAVPAGAALACMLLAAATLAGWALGSSSLIGAPVGQPQMYPVTAIGFLCAGCAILLQMRPLPALAARAAALLVLAIGVGSAVMRTGGWTLGPLTLGMGLESTAASLPGPLTAALFTALGASLLLLGAGRTVGVAQALAAGVLLFALITLSGFALEDTFLYQLLPGRGTSLRTALAFMLAAIAVLWLRPDQGMVVALASSSASSRTLRQLMAPMVLAPIALGMVATAAVRSSDSTVDLTTMIWLFVWGLLIILIAVVWRFAWQLYRQDLTRSLAERERNEALQALRLADERKNEFLAMLAHELRNPLAPISTAAELLGSVYASDPARVRRTSEIVARQVGHMVHLIDDLLDVSRVTRGMIELQRRQLDLRQAVADALEQVQPLMEAKRHRVRTEIPGARIVVDGDAKRLVQVLANLLGNAGKYTPEGGSIVVTVRCDDTSAQVAIQDDGIGIAPDLLPDVFGLFTQARRTPDRAQGGLGLGLALVKNLVELHGGQASAASAGAGQGSTFTITLPRLAGESASEPAPRSDVGRLPTPAPAAASVLVVDDNADAAAALALLLQGEGYRVRIEHASSAALRHVLADPPHACILDIGLPEMDGRELARRIRAELQDDAPLLVALSGYGSEQDRRAAADAGFDHYLVKPAGMQQLSAVLAGVGQPS